MLPPHSLSHAQCLPTLLCLLVLPSPLGISSVEPRSTCSATAAAATKAQQEDNEEKPVESVKKTHASVVKKVKKDKRCILVALCDAEDKAASAAAKKLTLTAKILKNNGADVALPPRSAGTGVQLGSATPHIVSDRARHPQSGDEEDPDDDEDPKNGEDSDVDEELAAIVDKGKGKARDLHNLGAESDKDSDADADAKDAANEDAADEDAKSEDMGVGDDGDGGLHGYTSQGHYFQAQHRTASHTSASSVPEGFPSPPPSDHLEDLQGASCTTGGFACGNAFGTASNMADFVHDDDVPTIHTHSSGKAISRKYAIVAKSMISMWDGVNNAGGLLPAPAYVIAAYSAKPNLIPFTQLLEVPPSLVPNTKPNVTLISAFDHWCAASDAPDCLRAAYNAYNAKVPHLPPLPAFPSVEDACAVFVNTTSFSNYGKLFPFAIQHPAILLYLQGDVPSGSTEYAALWGTLKPGLKTLGIVMKKLTDEKEKEEKKVKRKAEPSKLNLQAYFMLLVVWFLLGLVPCVAVASKQDPFPNMLFTEFAQSVQSNFGPKIKLSTVLMLLMTLVNNMDLLNLHGQQQASSQQESTSWMAALVCAVKAKLSDNDFASLFNCDDTQALQTPQQWVLKCKLHPISTTSVQPIIRITPMVMACPTLTCNKHSLTQELHERDTSQVTLLQGSQCFKNVPVLAGRCSICRTLYWADHECFTQNNGDDVCLYLNDAKYFKVGKSVWVDRLVSRAIVNANYSFHALTAAITRFWHFSFVQPSGVTFKLSCHQVWKAFVAESICHMASIDNQEIVFESNLSINALVAAAYAELGDGGIMSSKGSLMTLLLWLAMMRIMLCQTMRACQEHQPQWARFRRQYANTSLLGIQWMLRRAQEERQPWLLRAGEEEALGHDDLEEQENEEVSGTKYNNYFSAPRFYCVETLCAPCGVVIAWCKFAKAEGVAKILQFLEDIYPNIHSHPSYIAIDKGSPLNGDAPNLVVVANDKQGNPYYKRAFNTQACEQLNAWIGGFQTVLNWMTVNNFDFQQE
ncbi:hypothetical protein BDN71DRAFT_1545421 [Pleurotus eryngii]|uniref:CxC5 like cysteine cluster associated with KDZ domain-containing protein n=1 Tax=Pleurotus eryngii TaxID=5323 RepID=A0A9P6DAB4_PLEER|nr:hypothetical protein BDN71DRAFT_1545421 [Pleurotus eryngii]